MKHKIAFQDFIDYQYYQRKMIRYLVNHVIRHASNVWDLLKLIALSAMLRPLYQVMRLQGVYAKMASICH